MREGRLDGRADEVYCWFRVGQSALLQVASVGRRHHAIPFAGHPFFRSSDNQHSRWEVHGCGGNEAPGGKPADAGRSGFRPMRKRALGFSLPSWAVLRAADPGG